MSHGIDFVQDVLISVNEDVYTGGLLTQVQVRMPEKLIEEVDKWVAEGRFKSRSDAIKTIVALYEEKEKTREFYKMLNERSREAEERPDTLIPLEDTL
jgi:Arc/MetJ-type ribon-helix-helix transcriptional regulator